MSCLAFPKPARRGPKPRRPIRRTVGARAAALKAWRGLEKLCDDTFALYIRIRDNNRCRLCRSNASTQCAHLISRRYRQPRFLDENAWCLCASCHKRWTEDPLGWDDLMERTFGVVEWESRKSKARIPIKYTTSDYSLLRVALLAQLLHEAARRPPMLEPQLEKLLARHDRCEGRG